MSGRRRFLPVILCTVATVILVAAVYSIYVFCSYYRLDDNLTLSPEGNPGYAGQSLSEDGIYSILSWNIGFGAYSADYSFFMDGGKYSRALSADAVHTNISGVIDLISGAYPDFIFLQEVDTKATRSYDTDEKQLIMSGLNIYSCVFAQNFDSPYLFWPLLSPHGKNVSGIMTLTAYEAQSAVRRSLPIDEGLMKIVDLDRCYSVTKIPVSGDVFLCLYNVHLSAYTTDDSIQSEQLKTLVEDMKKEYEAGNYVIAGGDFNMDLPGNSSELFGTAKTNDSWAQPVPDGSIPEHFSVIAGTDVPSCRSAGKPYSKGSSFVVTVDGFIVSDNVEMLSSEVTDTGFAYSDHNPVIMKFRLG